MNNKLPCEIVQDLLPSYIDELTSDVTNTIIEEHVNECDNCRQVLASMKEPCTREVDQSDRKEIDFLKKTRNRTRKFVIASIAGTVLLISALIVIKMCFVGSYVNSDSVVCDVKVNGNKLELSGVTADDDLKIASVDYAEEDGGIVTVSFKCVQNNPFYDRDFNSEYTATNDITEIRLGDRVIWAKGQNISAITSNIFRSKHPYIGDMPRNGRTSSALNIANYLGDYKNELQTSSEPYVWKLILDNSIDNAHKSEKEEMMKNYGYIMISMIQNLGEVTFEYTVDGKASSVTVTEADATAYAGFNIRECYKEIYRLQELINKTGLTSYAYVENFNQWNGKKSIEINIMNNTDSDLTGLSIDYYINDKLIGCQNVQTGNQKSIRRGENTCFTFLPEDFGFNEWKNNMDVTLKLSVHNKEDITYELDSVVHVSSLYGYSYSYTLSGNAKHGYTISQ